MGVFVFYRMLPPILFPLSGCRLVKENNNSSRLVVFFHFITSMRPSVTWFLDGVYPVADVRWGLYRMAWCIAQLGS